MQSIKDPESLFTNKITIEEASKMCEVISDEEIKNVLFDIGDNKAPGPDGYTSKFYKKAWSVVGKEVCNAVRLFFQNGIMPKGINATSISLVPKMITLEKVSDFRPISCCTVLYKCISKILANRIKNVLGKIANKNQSAFIPERHISDNILVAQELMKGYERKYGVSRCALKIDLQKAFNTFSWEFIHTCLSNFGFHEKVIGWIMTCILVLGFQ